MPDFEISAPDGRKFVITAPDGASQDEVLNYFRQNMPTEQAAPQRGLAEQAMAIPTQAAAGVNDRLADVLGAPVDLAGKGLRAIGVPVPEDAFGGSASIRSGIRSLTGEAPKPQGALERAAYGAGSGAVDAASVLVPAAGIARAARTGSVIGGAAQQAMALPSLQVGAAAAGGAVGQATDSPLAGVATALALPIGAAGAARLISPVTNTLSPARAALVAAAEREGIPLSAGQATGSRVLQNMEGSFAQLPGTSGAEAAFAQTQQQAFNRAVLSRAGAVADNAGPDVLNRERVRIGGQIEDLANRNTMNFTSGVDADLRNIEGSLRFLTPEVGGPIRARIEQIRGMMTPNQIPTGSVTTPNSVIGTVPGYSYRQLDSELGRNIRSTSNGDLRAALSDIRGRLRTAMDDSISPADQAEWQQARREYANLMVAEKAVGGAGSGAAEGNISPLALRSAVNQSTGQGYARGQGDLNELARIGQGVLRAPPDSGTAGRTQMNQLLTGGGFSAGGSAVGAMIGGPIGAGVGAIGGLALPAIARAAYVNPLMQSYLRNQAVRPGTRQAITGLRNNLLAQQGLAQIND